MSEPQFLDDSNAYEVFASDLHHIESAGGGVLRLTFVVEKARGRVVQPVVHVLIPAAAIDAVRMRLAQGPRTAEPDDRERATAH